MPGLREMVAALAGMAEAVLQKQGGLRVEKEFPTLSTPIHPDVREYFLSAIPDKSVDLFEYYLDSRSEVLGFEKSNYAFLLPHGFLPIGSTPCGDLVCLQVPTGIVAVISHENLTEDGIGTALSRTLPLTADNLLLTAVENFGSLALFLDHWRHTADSILQKWRDFELAAVTDPNVQDEFGVSPLHWAAAQADHEEIEALIMRGAHVDLADHDGNTPLYLACRYRAPASVAGLLIGAGANVNHRNKQGETPLMWTARQSNLGCIKLLLSAGADPYARDRQGRQAIDHMCPVHGTPSIRRILRTAMQRPRG
ncbi:MAG: hypothetical protein AMXMBFR13_24850 [Phycisphaerae bacterium]